MIRTFSERLMPPYSGQVQIAESATYRALTIDGQVWEIQYVNRSHVRVATLTASEIKSQAQTPELLDQEIADEELVELLNHLAGIELPFPGTDVFEYWLLDSEDESPIALIFSCSTAAQMEKFPSRAEWTALPAAVMPVTKTEDEIRDDAPPVNYRLERQVAERAGINAKARWFERSASQQQQFPPFMVTENWSDAEQSALCQRYIDRQAPRLLMLQGLDHAHRQRLETSCRAYAGEVARFHGLYPEVLDKELIQSLRVEAHLRAASGNATQSTVHNRRDGVLYM